MTLFRVIFLVWYLVHGELHSDICKITKWKSTVTLGMSGECHRSPPAMGKEAKAGNLRCTILHWVSKFKVQNMELTLNNSKMKRYSSSADVCWQSHSGKEFVLVAQIHWGEGKTTQLHQFLKHIWLQILREFWMFLSPVTKIFDVKISSQLLCIQFSMGVITVQISGKYHIHSSIFFFSLYAYRPLPKACFESQMDFNRTGLKLQSHQFPSVV